MPSGSVHNALWNKGVGPVMVLATSMGIITTVTSHSVGVGATVAGGLCAGYLIGKFVTPDWDLISIDQFESKLIRSIIFLPLIAWTTLYARVMQAFGGHRSLFSHLPVFSTFMRLCWVMFPLVVLDYIQRWGIPFHNYLLHVGVIWMGMSIADTIHAAADFLPKKRRAVVRKIQSQRVKPKAKRSRSAAD